MKKKLYYEWAPNASVWMNFDPVTWMKVEKWLAKHADLVEQNTSDLAFWRSYYTNKAVEDKKQRKLRDELVKQIKLELDEKTIRKSERTKVMKELSVKILEGV